ncbi:MAG: hypothetical protein KC416_01580 [Myxococcales bacterium]|nr:hypothetical protein [Myxococcales bacterium]
MTKNYAIDEFYYAQEAWRLAMMRPPLAPILAGEPFVPTYLWSLVASASEGNPEHMIWLRYQMLGVFILYLGAIAWIASRHTQRPWLAGSMAALFLFSLRTFVFRAIEVRPDSIALLFLTGSVAVLYVNRWPPRVVALLSGLALFLAAMASRKAVLYGAAFLPVFLWDLRLLRRGDPPATRSPFFFFLGGAVPLLAMLGLIGFHGTFERVLASYNRTVAHEIHYPEIDVLKNLLPTIVESPLLFLFGGLGAAALMAPRWAFGANEQRDPRRVLLVLLLVSTWASYFIQKAPYAYSLLPGLAFLAVTAGRWVDGLFSTPAPRWWLALGLVLPLWSAVVGAYALEPKRTNERQRELHRELNELTDPSDTIYDMSSTFAFRPRAHRFGFVDKARFSAMRAEIEQEVPQALEDNETMLFVQDLRFRRFSGSPLARYIRFHYHPYNADFWVRGRHWNQNGVGWEDTFTALRTAKYFVHPEEAVEGLRVDGRALSGPAVELEKGVHSVSWTPTPGSTPGDIFLLWLPRNGQRFDPTRRFPKYALGRYVF